VNNTDVQTPNPGCKPKLDKNCKLVPQIWLVDWSHTWWNQALHP